MNKTKLFLLSSILCVSLSLSACDVKYSYIVNSTDNAASAIQNIIDRNCEYVDLLSNAGFIDKSDVEYWKENIKAKLNPYLDKLNKRSPDKLDDSFTGAVTPYSIVKLNAYLTEEYSKHGISELEHLGLSNTDSSKIKLGDSNNDSEDEGIDNPYYKKDKLNSLAKIDPKSLNSSIGDSNPKAISLKLFDGEQQDKLQKQLSKKVAIITNFEDSSGSIQSPDKLNAILAILKGDSERAKRIIEDNSLELEKVRDVTLQTYVDRISNLTYDEVSALEEALLSYCKSTDTQYMKVGTYAEQQNDTIGGKRRDSEGNPYIFADTVPSENVVEKIGKVGEAGTNKLGNDVIITSDGVPALSLRVQEFNPDLIQVVNDNLKLREAQVTGKYYVTKTKDFVIKLDYPLYKIDTIKSNGNKTWEVVPTDTGLFMDILTGNILDDKGNVLDYGGQFYTADSVNFWYDGTYDKEIEIIKDQKFKIRPLVLRDYVELYKIQDSDGKGLVDKDEMWAALGRKLRVQKFRGNTDLDIAHFALTLDSNGEYPEAKNYISLESIADRTSGYDYYTGYSENLALKDIKNTEKVDEAIKSGDRSGKLMEHSGIKIEKGGIKFQGQVYFDNINPVICMGDNKPEQALASLDNKGVYEKNSSGTYDLPTVYGMCISKSIKETNYVGSEWLGSNAASSTGLVAWNIWLGKMRFYYRVDIDKLLNILSIQKLSLENSEDSGIVFDQDTVSRVTENMEEKKSKNILTYMVTVSKLVGFLLYGYATLLMAAWAVDVNISGGFKLFKFLTFGNRIAIRDAEELQYLRSNTGYTDLKGLVGLLFGICAIASVLLLVDIMNFQSLVMKLIEPLKNALETLLTGL